MISKQHTKLRYEEGYWEDIDVFYDFQKEDERFLKSTSESASALKKKNRNKKNKGGRNDEQDMIMTTTTATTTMDIDDNEEGGWEDAPDDDNDDGGWEDVPEGEEGEEEEDGDDEDDMYAGYEEEVAKFGLDVTPLGELIFPDGRIVGHRTLRRYYKQRVRPVNTSTAIVAAQRAANERLYEGRVIDISGLGPASKLSANTGSGKGILVPVGGGNGNGNTGNGMVGGNFSALSLYRYRAAIQKQRRDDQRGLRLKYKTTQNINRMDKKANRLMNGVSVAHAAR